MGDVSKACKAAGVSRTAIYEHRKNDAAFAEAWSDVLESLCDAAEAELYRRGVKGWSEPVFYKGNKVASIRKFDTRALELVLKANRPKKFREQIDIDLTMKTVKEMTDEELEALTAS